MLHVVIIDDIGITNRTENKINHRNHIGYQICKYFIDNLLSIHGMWALLVEYTRIFPDWIPSRNYLEFAANYLYPCNLIHRFLSIHNRSSSFSIRINRTDNLSEIYYA